MDKSYFVCIRLVDPSGCMTVVIMIILIMSLTSKDMMNMDFIVFHVNGVILLKDMSTLE